MKKRIFLALLCLTGAVMLSASSCPNATIDTGDQSPPAVSCRVKVGDGQFMDVPAGDTPINVRFDQEVNVACTAEDPQGMSIARLEFPQKTVTSCVKGELTLSTNVNTTLYGLPENDITETAKVVSGNQVTTKLILIGKIGQ